MATTKTKKDTTTITSTKGKTKEELRKMNVASLVEGILNGRRDMTDMVAAMRAFITTINAIIKRE